jgi:dihydroorotate dehydrogenase electron transfer subunit
MIQTPATVVRNEMVIAGYGRIGLACEAAFIKARPGQFVMLGLPDSIDPLLRRPFSIHRLTGPPPEEVGIELLYKVVGRATRRIARLQVGESVSLLGPLGRGFQVPAAVGSIDFVAGGFGVAPFVFLAQWLKERHPDLSGCRLFLGGRGREDLLCAEDFERLGIHVRLTTDDGSCGEQCLVTDPFAAAVEQSRPDLVLACGPPAMLACVIGIVRRHGIPCQVSIETMMACGMGACLGCAVTARRDPTRYLHACVDGPVFDADDIDF